MNDYKSACDDLTAMFQRALQNGQEEFAWELLDTITDWSEQ